MDRRPDSKTLPCKGGRSLCKNFVKTGENQVRKTTSAETSTVKGVRARLKTFVKRAGGRGVLHMKLKHDGGQQLTAPEQPS